VEHACHKCGASVEQGVPFCKQCGAPQIRVIGIEPEPVIAPAAGERPQEPLAPPPLPVRRPSFAGVSLSAVQWSHALPGAALGGVFSLLAMVIPYAVFGPAFLIGGGLAVMLYRRTVGGVLPTPGAGARIGAASGGFGFLYLAVLAVATAVYRSAEVRDAMLESLSQMTARGYDPQKVAQVQELIKSPGGVMVFLAFGLFMMLLIMVVGSSIGGAFYAAWSRRRPTF
jgi:hypothetical protein